MVCSGRPGSFASSDVKLGLAFWPRRTHCQCCAWTFRPRKTHQCSVQCNKIIWPDVQWQAVVEEPLWLSVAWAKQDVVWWMYCIYSNSRPWVWFTFLASFIFLSHITFFSLPSATGGKTGSIASSYPKFGVALNLARRAKQLAPIARGDVPEYDTRLPALALPWTTHHLATLAQTRDFQII
jgi:hypothetical protein